MFWNLSENFLNIVKQFSGNVWYMLGGFANNMYFSIIAMFFGFVGGFFLACFQFVYKDKWPAKVSNGIVSVICGTPMLVQLAIYYYVVPSVVPISNMLSAVIGISFNSACYFSLMFIDAMFSIDDTYFLNLRGLNVSRSEAIKNFLLPMVIKNAYNKITYEFVNLLKETAILNAIGVSDVFSRAKEMAYRSNSSYFTYMCICASMFYLFYILHKNFMHRFVNSLLVKLLKFVLRTSNLMLLIYGSSAYLLYAIGMRLWLFIYRIYL